MSYNYSYYAVWVNFDKVDSLGAGYIFIETIHFRTTIRVIRTSLVSDYKYLFGQQRRTTKQFGSSSCGCKMHSITQYDANIIVLLATLMFAVLACMEHNTTAHNNEVHSFANSAAACCISIHSMRIVQNACVIFMNYSSQYNYYISSDEEEQNRIKNKDTYI